MSKAKVTPVDTLPADLSPAIAAIERAYRKIQKVYPDTPNATIVVKRDQRAWGHTSVAKLWAAAAAGDKAVADRFEIMISGENLRRGAEAVVGTLLHEAAHARNLGKGVLDTDTNGRHNKLFADVATEHGLTVRQHGWHGYADTELSEAGKLRWKVLLGMVERGMAKAAAAASPDVSHVPGLEGVTPVITPGGNISITPPRRRGNRNLLSASCDCGHKIRVSRGVLDKAEPTCSACGSKFTA